MELQSHTDSSFKPSVQFLIELMSQREQIFMQEAPYTNFILFFIFFDTKGTSRKLTKPKNED